ncbi:MAG: flagellar hook-basal body complex protein FliE [Gemmatimonadales bacterium]|jgi:flagellar hook-basal body complex protein FliE|nr:flagellar hook-basal body complex protein FliE [Gemmatimonadales bacterium]MDZ4257275.1 flagellar hook-basal body complex protein FliE [Gemmatimonadales bacterium]MDZ4388964.1 flagellar hook-basal body complex protein FliE [Gemmatimonadales bacterium]
MTAPIRPPIMPVGPLPPMIPSGGGDAGATPFGDLLTRALGDVNRIQDTKADLIGAFLRGEAVELHEVMAAAEEASLSLELLVETRNKFTEAYRTLMNIQI